VGLKELVAADVDDYVRIAADLASDIPRLEACRATLRQRMIESLLCDEVGFVRRMESALAAMWSASPAPAEEH
jgi:predicted O-linked N-acetylglucosamine transferase (SPINDLY family)